MIEATLVFRWSPASRPVLRRSPLVRFAPKATEVLRCRELTRSAKSGLVHCSKIGASFDHLVAPVGSHGECGDPDANLVCVYMCS